MLKLMDNKAITIYAQNIVPVSMVSTLGQLYCSIRSPCYNATIYDSVEPAHPHSLLWVLVVHASMELSSGFLKWKVPFSCEMSSALKLMKSSFVNQTTCYL